MNKVSRLTLTIVLILGAALLAGCTRSYSRPPKLLRPNQMVLNAPAAVGGAEQQPSLTPAESADPSPAPEEAAEPEEPQPPAIPTLERPSTYILQKGEWPICIARRFDINIADLFAANGLTMDSRPGAGITLQLPAGGSWSSGSHGSRSLRAHEPYTVKTGDTLNAIACYFGDVSPEGIMAANGLEDPGAIEPGMQLTIP